MTWFIIIVIITVIIIVAYYYSLTMRSAVNRLDWDITKNALYLTLMGKLWGEFYEYFGEKKLYIIKMFDYNC